MDWKIELIPVPVTDVDRAKAFYVDQAGFDADHDTQVSDTMRVVQLTPRGSACSIVIGTGLNSMSPGSIEGLQLVTTDMDAARGKLIERGVDVSEVVSMGREGGDTSFKFANFKDPDGNAWVLQEIPS
jgi:predicted enzyme related to lactoylglutathione lyase